MVATGQRIPGDFEWNGFVKRNGGVLIDPQAPPRSLANVSFPNQDHKATKPLLAGSLDRKGKLMRKYDTSYYVITPSKFLHEFKTDDDIAKDPTPEMSLYLPDCTVGALDGQKFNIKGKDMNKKLGVNLSTSHEYQFKAHTIPDGQIWYEVVKDCAGQLDNSVPSTSAPSSPVMDKQATTSSTAAQPSALQTQGITGDEKVMSPTSATTGANPSVPSSSTAGPGELPAHTAAPTGGQTSGLEKKPGEY